MSVGSYSQKYIDQCCSNISELLASYKGLIASAKINSAVEAFEPNFFDHMVLVLDSYFCHRSRTMELKGGNPLNEVRMLCNSAMNNNSKLGADKTIKYVPENSVLKYEIGDEINLNVSDFNRLYKGFFAEIESKYKA